MAGCDSPEVIMLAMRNATPPHHARAKKMWPSFHNFNFSLGTCILQHRTTR